MAKTINITLDNKSINQAIREVNRYKKWVAQKTKELRLKLANLGVSVASVRFSGAVYDGTNDVSVRVDDDGMMATIYAEGEAVCFIEFGSGAELGYGHPTASELGFGPGTWSDGPNGKHHWNEKTKKGAYKGWWYGTDGKHTYGNPPAQAMLAARNEIVENVMRIAREVFSQ